MSIGPIRPKADTSNTFQPVRVFRKQSLDVSSGKLAMAGATDTLGSAMFEVGFKEAKLRSEQTGINEYRSLGAKDFTTDVRKFLDAEETKPNPNFGKPVALGKNIGGGQIAQQAYEDLVIKGYFDAQETALNNKNIELYNKVGKNGYSIAQYQTEFSQYADSLVKYALPQFKNPIQRAGANVLTKNVIKLQQERAEKTRVATVNNALESIQKEIETYEIFVETLGANDPVTLEQKDKINSIKSNDGIIDYIKTKPSVGRAIDKQIEVAKANATSRKISQAVISKYGTNTKILSMYSEAMKVLENTNNSNAIQVQEFNEKTKYEFKTEIESITSSSSPAERASTLTNIRQQVAIQSDETIKEEVDNAYKVISNESYSQSYESNFDSIINNIYEGMKKGLDVTGSLNNLDSFTSTKFQTQIFKGAGGDPTTDAGQKLIQQSVKVAKEQVALFKKDIPNRASQFLTNEINASLDKVFQGEDAQQNLGKIARRMSELVMDIKQGTQIDSTKHKEVLQMLSVNGTGTYASASDLKKAINNVINGNYFIGSDKLDLNKFQKDTNANKFADSISDILNQNRNIMLQEVFQLNTAALKNEQIRVIENAGNVAQQTENSLKTELGYRPTKEFFSKAIQRRKDDLETIKTTIDGMAIFTNDEERNLEFSKQKKLYDINYNKSFIRYAFEGAGENFGGMNYATNFYNYMSQGGEDNLEILSKGNTVLKDFYEPLQNFISKDTTLNNVLSTTFNQLLKAHKKNKSQQEVSALYATINEGIKGKYDVFNSELTSNQKTHLENDFTGDITKDDFKKNIPILALFRNSTNNFVPKKITNAIKAITTNPGIYGNNINMVIENLSTYFSTQNDNQSSYNVMKRLARENQNQISIADINKFESFLAFHRSELAGNKEFTGAKAREYIKSTTQFNLEHYFDIPEGEENTSYLTEARNIYNTVMGNENLNRIHFTNFMSQFGEYFEYHVSKYNQQRLNAPEDDQKDMMSNESFFHETVKTFLDMNFQEYDEDEYRAFGPSKSNINLKAIGYNQAEILQFKTNIINDLNKNVTGLLPIRFQQGTAIIEKDGTPTFMLKSEYDLQVEAYQDAGQTIQLNEFKGSTIPVLFHSFGNNTFQAVNPEGNPLVFPNKEFNNQITIWEYNINEKLGPPIDLDVMNDELINQFRMKITDKEFQKDVIAYSQGRPITIDFLPDVKKDSTAYQGYMRAVQQGVKNFQNIYRGGGKLKFNEYLQFLHADIENN